MKLFPTRRVVLKYLRLFVFLVVLKGLWIAFFYEDGTRLLAGSATTDLLSRRRYLVERVYLQQAGPSDMPEMLPAQFQGEWALGTYSMTASALTSLAFTTPETRVESLEVVNSLIERTLGAAVKRFDADRWGEDPLTSLDGDNGHIGYLGHLNWLFGTYKFLGGDERYDDRYEAVSAALARRLGRRPGLCLETYPGETYVPDNVVVLASLANFARLHGGRQGEVVQRWVDHARSQLLDRGTGLLPFLLDGECRPAGGVRGSGAAWNSFFLPFVDRSFAAEQYRALNTHLVANIPVPGVREFPRGVSGQGDVDSGPVIFGLSTSGTGFAVGGAVHAGDSSLISRLLFTAELAGSTVVWQGRRHYLLAPLVGEAILLAMKTAQVWEKPLPPHR